MPHFPKPFKKQSRNTWYVQLGPKQINLGPDKDEAFRRYHQIMAQPQQQKVAAESLPAIIDAFLDWVQKNRAPETYEWYRYRLQRLIDRYPNIATLDLKPLHIQQWVDSYGSLSRTTQRNYMRSIKVCLDWAVQQGYIERNPLFKMRIPTAEAREVAITQDEFDRLLTFVRNDSFADLVTTTWETGCRPQESLIVESRHVDLANQRWVFSRKEEKTRRHTRVVYLTDSALAITRRQMLAHPTGPLFRNSHGGPWTTDAVNCAFLAIQLRMGKEEMQRRGVEITDDQISALTPSLKPQKTVKGDAREKSAAELRAEAKRKLTHKVASSLAPRYSLYALRHSWATNALTRGVDPLTVAILMGHQDPSTLAKVYQHLSLNPQHLLDQAKKAAG